MTGNVKNEPRYDMRKQPNGLWTVYDIFTGQPAWVNGVELRGLDIEEADDLVDLLNGMYVRRRKDNG